MKYLILLNIFVILVSGCAEAMQDGVDDGEPAGISVGGKADIYGTDSRREPYESSVSSIHRRAAQSVALMVTPGGWWDVDRLNPGSLAAKMERSLGGPLCSSEPLREEPAPGYCTAFLIAPDLVATAGHCINVKQHCGRVTFVFDYAKEHSSDDPTRIDRDDVYRCTAVVGHEYDPALTLASLSSGEKGQDWAVVKLDRPVTGRTPLRLASSRPADGESVWALGHPSGLPLKVTSGRVVDASKEAQFHTDLDIYGGNSGSPVVDAAGDVQGIAVRGSGGQSFVRTDAGCYASRRCDSVTSGTCGGNEVLRPTRVAEYFGAVATTHNQLVSDGDIPDGSSTGVGASMDVSTSQTLGMVTFSANLWHTTPRDLQIEVEHGGRRATLQGLKSWPGGEVHYTRTTDAFRGMQSSGDWKIRLVDPVSSGASWQTVSWWQVATVRGGAEAAPPTSSPGAWIGTPCTGDSDCDFSSSGAFGFCYDDGAGAGFCSVPCEGFCPDRSGHAVTFCVESDAAGTGVCAARAGDVNRWCAEVPGTSAQVLPRWIGSSSAVPAEREVCMF